MTLGIVKRNEQEFAEWLAKEWGFLCALGSFDDEAIVLEPYQIAFLENRSRFRWVTKSRQVGFSFLFGLEALARCHLRNRHTAVFVSYNLDDAKERWATDFKILLQQCDILLPRDREMVAQIHAIKRRVLPSGKISFDAERTSRGHTDRFWAIALACQKEQGGSTTTKGAAVTVRVIG